MRVRGDSTIPNLLELHIYVLQGKHAYRAVSSEFVCMW